MSESEREDFGNGNDSVRLWHAKKTIKAKQRCATTHPAVFPVRFLDTRERNVVPSLHPASTTPSFGLALSLSKTYSNNSPV